MFSTLLGLILVPATFAFILGFLAHFFKTQAEKAPEETTTEEPATPLPTAP